MAPFRYGSTPNPPVANGSAPGRDQAFTPTVGGTISLMNERRGQGRRDRQRMEPIWHLCQAFISNRQWVGWSRRDRRIVLEPNPMNRERHTANVLTARLMTNLGKFVSDDMLPSLFFRNDSSESLEFQKQASRALEYCWYEELEAEERIYETLLNTCVFGLGGVQARWDPTHGPLIAQNVPYVDGKPILDPQQATTHVAESYGQGRSVEFRDVKGVCSWDVLSPFNIIPPPGVAHERNFPWLIVERPISLDVARAIYGSKAARLQEQDLEAVDTIGLRDIAADPSDSGTGVPGKLKGHILLSTCYEMPTSAHPRGRTVTWSKETLLDERDGLPYTIKGEPHIGIRFFKYQRVPGRFWPIGLVEPGIGPQRQRNRSRSQWIEIKDRAGLGRIYTRPGALTVGQLPGGKAMEVIEVRQGIDIPTETAGVGPGQWIAQDVQMHDTDLDRVMGMGEVTGGNAPGGVSAYSAMALLADQDDKRVGPILKQIRYEVQWLVKYTLNDIRTYWPPNKQIMVAGDEDAIQAFVFNAAQLPEDCYVKVGTGAPVPRNQAAEIQKIFDLYDRSVSGGAPLPMQWLYDSIQAGKALPLPQGLSEAQQEKAEVENLLIARGGVVQVSPLDNHQVHIQIHTEAATNHQLIPGAGDVVRALVEHIQEHQEAMQQAAAPATTSPMLQGGMGALGGQTAGAPTPPDLPIQFVNQQSPRPGNIIAGPDQLGRRF